MDPDDRHARRMNFDGGDESRLDFEDHDADPRDVEDARPGLRDLESREAGQLEDRGARPPDFEDRGASAAKLEAAEGQIRQAWIAGVISGVLTLLLTVVVLAGGNVLRQVGLDAWNFVDVALIFGLTYGVYRKSRVCATLLFVYFVGSKLLTLQQMGKPAGLGIALIFGYFFFQGIRGTLAYHRLAPRPVDSSVRRRPVWLWIGGLFTALVVVAVVALVYIGSVGPGSAVVPGPQVSKRHVDQIRELGLLEPGEEIKFFYSDALVDIKDGFYFFTDRKVVVYRQDAETSALVVRYPEIEDIEAQLNESFFEDSLIILILTDDRMVWFPVSSENGGDRRFFESLKGTWKARKPPEAGAAIRPQRIPDAVSFRA